MEASKSTIFSVGQYARNPEKIQYCDSNLKAIKLKTQEEVDVLYFKHEVHLMQNPLLLRGGQSFVLFSPSADWGRHTHFMESSLLYSKSINLNVNLIQKYPHINIQNNV